MISLDIIEKEISELETRDTTYNVLERLSWLYVCRDHLIKNKAEERIASPAFSDFLSAVDGKPINAVLEIIDECMNCLNACYPNAYANIMKRIQDI